MSATLASRAASRPLAVAVRVIAFLVAAASVLTIPTTLVEAGIGHVTASAALATIAIAGLLIVAAAVAVRSFDPLRA